MLLSFSEFSIDSETLELNVDGHCLAIDERNMTLLAMLAERYPDYCTKQECLALIWQETIVSDMSLSKLVSDTRKLFCKAGYQGPLIQTVHGRGYRLEHQLGKQLLAQADKNDDVIEPIKMQAPEQVIDSCQDKKAPQQLVSQPSGWELLAKALIALLLILGLFFQFWQGGVSSSDPMRQLAYSEPHNAVGRVLWVDDHPENNLVEKAYLEQKNIGVYNTVTSEEALMLLSMYHYQAVISDMGRHGDSLAGLKLLQAIRAKGNKTPFYLYTYVESPGLVDAVYESGGQAVVIDSESLYQLLLSHFEAEN
ncbi:winged helix-turn-helix domain-containing protein [Shewanella pealeana]|uniref:Transcriptional regulator, CadC n=1 Tax=Shewanella pealeana (strain ATCC 700345 / ANG-SQ1) TaxID=398579 RepID=A8H0E1_SHEPA|nr:winged helix-turn-helix domain-containing protein [Shewanella pealeana]ABV86028.1 transcriptional regulator, CadC [Shewanella pealeana ATCC 700345]